MLYNSTVNKNIKVKSAQAIACGISPDGGLFVPESFYKLSDDDFKELISLDYRGRAQKILSLYLTDFTDEEIKECVEKAYAPEKFCGDNPAPIYTCTYSGNEINILELWHGPTSAFKDMALQILPHLLTKSLKKSGCDSEAVILVATSGDTGKAALEGFKDVEGTRLVVFYPENGVSSMQKHQMNTQEGENVNVCAIKGNFDDAQSGVKSIFTDESVKSRLALGNKLFSSANSINWGRLLPQIVYYISAYCELVSIDSIKYGDKINITVPTGNFGNILAAYYAYRMGLPVNKFICASNVNNVLTDFINTGRYDKNRTFYTTVSPSMDILISSNLERFLYHITDGDDKQTASWMMKLKSEGTYTVDEVYRKKINDLFCGFYCDDNKTKETIGKLYRESDYLCDTHTAVAINAYEQYVKKTGDKTPVIIASTASPYKFSAAVFDALDMERDKCISEFEKLEMLSDATHTQIPKPIAELKEKKVRFNNVITKEDMEKFITNYLGV